MSTQKLVGRFIVAILAAAMFAAACGSDSDETTPAAFGDDDNLQETCETVPVDVPGITILGQRVESIEDLEVCIGAGANVGVVPVVKNQPQCGTPCMTVEIQNFDVSADVSVNISFMRDKKPQTIEYVVPVDVRPAQGRLCIIGIGGPPDPCAERVTTPEDLVAQAGRRQVSLSWGESVDTSGGEILGYEIYRSLTGEEGSFTLLASTTETSYLDTAEITKGQNYYYYVSAIDTDGNRSEASNVATVTANWSRKK
jgi:hypothetical protein